MSETANVPPELTKLLDCARWIVDVIDFPMGNGIVMATMDSGRMVARMSSPREIFGEDIRATAPADGVIAGADGTVMVWDFGDRENDYRRRLRHHVRDYLSRNDARQAALIVRSYVHVCVNAAEYSRSESLIRDDPEQHRRTARSASVILLAGGGSHLTVIGVFDVVSESHDWIVCNDFGKPYHLITSEELAAILEESRKR